MLKKQLIRLFSSICLAVFSTSLFAQADMQDSQDHPNIPRIEGTVIWGFAESSYDEGEFITGMENRKLQTVMAEGKRTRIVYAAPKNVAPLMALRNYQSALAELGEVEQIFLCKKETCYGNLPKIFMWSSQRRVNNIVPGSQWAYGNTSYYKDQLYWYGTVTGDSVRYHVSVYSSIFSDNNQVKQVRGTPTIHLEVVEEADFKPSLQVVEPDEITSSITEKGHIALYGIHFDFDSAVLKPGSQPELQSIATALNADTSLKVYVVGHTDNQGTYEYNLDLSKQRAASVVQALAGNHGVAQDQMRAAGVGPVAPVATNTTEKGQALNRRVELVAF